MRPDASQYPSIELGEKLADVGSAEMLAPAADDRIKFSDQLAGDYRSFKPGTLPNLILEMLNRLFPRVCVQVALTAPCTDLARCQLHRPATSLDLVPQKFEAGRDVYDSRLFDVERHS